MSVQPQPPGSYRFGPFLADAPAGQLRKGATKLRLAGQPFEILLMLLERPGQVVTREEIQQRLWPQQTFVDFENSLNKAINKLRQALSDSAEEPAYIETLPRRGYRFVGSLLPPSSGSRDYQMGVPIPVAGQSQEPVVQKPRVSPKSPLIWRAVALSLFVSAAFVFWLSVRPLPAPRALRAVPLTDSSRVDLYGGLQTDGVRLFFLLRRGHRWDLAQMPVSGGDVQPVAIPFPNARIFSISPDGSQFALGPFDSRTPALPVWLMSSVGGTPRRLGDIVVNDATFTREGTKITYSTQEGIFEVGLDAQNARKLTNIPGSKWGLAWSLDGSRLRFDWADPPDGPSHIWEIRADGTNLHQILPGWTRAEGLCCGRWSADGRYFFFLASSQETPSGVWVLREPYGIFRRQEEPHRLSTDPLPVSSVLPAPDGKRVYLLGNKTRSEYVRVDPKTHQIRGLLGGQPAAWASIAPAGDWAVFRGSGDALWRAKLDGTSRIELIGGKMQPAIPSIRPDGHLIAFRGQRPGDSVSRIFVVSSEGGAPIEVASASFPLDAPVWSSDGKKLSYFLDGDDDPISGIYVMDFASRETYKIPGSEKFWRFRWSPDSKYLASVSTDNSSVALYDLAAKKWTSVAHGKVISPVMWSQDSTSLFFQDILEEGEPVRHLRIKDLSIERSFECAALLEGGVLRCGLEGLAPDGSFLFQLNRGDHDVFALDVELP